MRSPLEKYQSDATVKGPSLPMYIIRMDRSFAPTPRLGVIPVESPTVPKALVTSKSASMSGTCGSSSAMAHVPSTTTAIASSVMTAAFRKASLGMAL